MEVAINPITGSERAYGGAACHKIEILDVSGDHTLGYVVANRHDSAVVVDAEFQWELINTSEDSIRFQEVPRTEDGVTFYDGRIQFIVPKDTADRIAQLAGQKRRRYLVRWIDSNGQGKMMGDLANGAVFEMLSRDNKADPDTDNEITCQFAVCARHPVPFYPFESEIFDGECCAEQTSSDSGGNTGGGDCQDGTVLRTNPVSGADEPYFTVPSGGTHVIPPKLIGDQDNQAFSMTVGKPVLIGYDPAQSPPFNLAIASIVETELSVVINVNAPRTAGQQYNITQRTTYYGRDEGYQIQNGIWTKPTGLVRRLNFLANDPFNTLADVNPFGNTTRLCDSQGNPLTTYGGMGVPADGLVIDTLYDAMWYVHQMTYPNWTAACDAVAASTEGGFNDWVIATREHLHTIIPHDQTEATEPPGFPPNYLVSASSSTTIHGSQLWKYFASSDRQFTEVNKTSTQRILMVRPYTYP